MTNCPLCSSENPDGIKYCTNCGSPLLGSSVNSAQSVIEQSPVIQETPDAQSFFGAQETSDPLTSSAPQQAPSAQPFSEPTPFSEPQPFNQSGAQSFSAPQQTGGFASAPQQTGGFAASAPQTFGQQPASASQPFGQPSSQPQSFVPGVGSQPSSQPSSFIPNSATGYQQAPIVAAAASPYSTAQAKTSALCVVAFIISILSIFCCGLTAPIALILSIVGLVIASKNSLKGKGLAIAGVVISAIFTLWFLICLLAGGYSAFMEGFMSEYNKDREAEETVVDYEKYIQDNNWISAKDGSYLVFESKTKFKYYREKDVDDDYYYAGKYEIYIGKDAIEYVTDELSDYGLTEDEIHDLIKRNKEYTEDNFMLLLLINETWIIDGEDVADKSWTTPYVGCIIDQGDYYAMDLTNMDAANYFFFEPEDESSFKQ